MKRDRKAAFRGVVAAAIAFSGSTLASRGHAAEATLEPVAAAETGRSASRSSKTIEGGISDRKQLLISTGYRF